MPACMDSNARNDIWLAVPLFLICLLYPLPSLALQPLDAFVASARTQNADALEARATADEQRAEADASLGKRLPGVALRGSYAQPVRRDHRAPARRSS
jgi:outer membrane protein TolC